MIYFKSHRNRTLIIYVICIRTWRCCDQPIVDTMSFVGIVNCQSTASIAKTLGSRIIKWFSRLSGNDIRRMSRAIGMFWQNFVCDRTLTSGCIYCKQCNLMSLSVSNLNIDIMSNLWHHSNDRYQHIRTATIWYLYYVMWYTKHFSLIF